MNKQEPDGTPDPWGHLPWGQWETPEEENKYWEQENFTKSKEQFPTSKPTRATITTDKNNT
jgi:hypothetical protein